MPKAWFDTQDLNPPLHWLLDQKWSNQITLKKRSYQSIKQVEASSASATRRASKKKIGASARLRGGQGDSSRADDHTRVRPSLMLSPRASGRCLSKQRPWGKAPVSHGLEESMGKTNQRPTVSHSSETRGQGPSSRSGGMVGVGYIPKERQKSDYLYPPISSLFVWDMLAIRSPCREPGLAATPPNPVQTRKRRKKPLLPLHTHRPDLLFSDFFLCLFSSIQLHTHWPTEQLRRWTRMLYPSCELQHLIA